MIQGTLAKVSTLLMLVGLPPQAVDGRVAAARARGMPRWPSMLAMSAVSSPQTKAPAPCVDVDVEVEARAEDVVAQQAALARLPRALASRRSTASGYSART